MEKEQFFKLLKQYLSITVDQERGSDKLTIAIYFDGKEVCKAHEYLTMSDDANYWGYMETNRTPETDNILKAFAEIEKSTKRGKINLIIPTTPSGYNALYDCYKEMNKE